MSIYEVREIRPPRAGGKCSKEAYSHIEQIEYSMSPLLPLEAASIKIAWQLIGPASGEGQPLVRGGAAGLQGFILAAEECVDRKLAEICGKRHQGEPRGDYRRVVAVRSW